jgi:CxxC motif-containing protein (DUF1111 family)
VIAVAALTLGGSSEPPPPDDATLAGGDATTLDASARAFAQFIPTLTREERRAFAVGNNFFNDNWVTAPASTEGRDGLGPLFNAQSCSTCHFADGRGSPPLDADDPTRGLLVRISVLDEAGNPIPVPGYGDQLQDRSIEGVAPEATIVITRETIVGSYGDGTTFELEAPTYALTDLAYGALPDDVLVSPRVAPPVFGVGLLEAIPAASIVAAADPADADGDGVSGRPNLVAGRSGEQLLGRFGWKASVVTVNAQNAAAFVGDIGITSSLHPDQPCEPVQIDCAAAPAGGDPEIDEHKLERVTFYTRTLAVPARRDVGSPDTDAGEELFGAIGCASCHTPTQQTGDSDVAALADQMIHPYTDLLLHDMGQGLADGRPDGDATGSEWRTAPLWGIGLTATVSGHTRFLHDGRARNLTEAILWHGGEAADAQERFRELSAADRRRLLAFLESL